MMHTHCQLRITVLLAVKNEEANLPKCLASLISAERGTLLDSQSQDRTKEMATSYGAEIARCLTNLIASISYATLTIQLGRLAWALHLARE